MKVNDKELARSVFNPKRMRILKLVDKKAKTVKEMADELNEKPSRLYYHVHKLLELGLLEVAETKQVGHLTEAYYKAASDIGPFDIDESFAKDNAGFVIKQLLIYINNGIDTLRSDIEQGSSIDELSSSASILQAKLTQKEWLALNEEIRQLINKRTSELSETDEKDKRDLTYILMSFAEE